MNLSLRPRYKQILAVIAIIIIVALLIQSSFKTWLAYSYAEGPQPEGLRLASAIDPSNPDYSFLIAFYLMEYDDQSSYETALEEYKKALTLSPFNHNYWFYLAELLHYGGQREQALYALSEATTLSPGSVSLRWRAGMLASKLGDRESVLDNLSAVIEYDPHRRWKAFALLWQAVGNEDKIFNSISDNALSSYFYYLRTTSRIDQAGKVFEKLRKLNYDTSIVAYKYVADLIRDGDIDSAQQIWIGTYGDWDGVWNGSFEEDMKNDGFDWRLGRVEGVKIKRDIDSHSGDYSLMVNFDSKHNIEFSHLSQVIPVQDKSSYTINLYVKTDEIVTSEDLQWQVYCLYTDELDARSSLILGTHDWKPYTISFTAPQGCGAINLRLILDKSDKINKLISGTLWVDEVSMTRNN